MKPRRASESATLHLELATKVLSAGTHYEALGVPFRVDAEALKLAHRRLASVFHPDRCRLECSHDVMSRLNLAYACLEDPAARKRYDTINRLKPCDACRGTGHLYGQLGFRGKVRKTCHLCEGRGLC